MAPLPAVLAVLVVLVVLVAAVALVADSRLRFCRASSRAAGRPPYRYRIRVRRSLRARLDPERKRTQRG